MNEFGAVILIFFEYDYFSAVDIDIKIYSRIKMTSDSIYFKFSTSLTKN